MTGQKYLLEGLFPERVYRCSRCRREWGWEEYVWRCYPTRAGRRFAARRLCGLCRECRDQDRGSPQDLWQRRRRYAQGKAELAATWERPGYHQAGVVEGPSEGRRKLVIANRTVNGQGDADPTVPRPQARPCVRRQQRPGTAAAYFNLPVLLKTWLRAQARREGKKMTTFVVDLLRAYRLRVEAAEAADPLELSVQLQRVTEDNARLRETLARLQSAPRAAENPTNPTEDPQP